MKFTVGGEFLYVVFVDAYKFSGLSGCGYVINKSGYWVCGWRKLVFVVERIDI